MLTGATAEGTVALGQTGNGWKQSRNLLNERVVAAAATGCQHKECHDSR